MVDKTGLAIGPGKSAGATVQVVDFRRKAAGARKPSATELAARIYRATVGAFDTPVDEVRESKGFVEFCQLRGAEVVPLTPLFSLEYYWNQRPAHLALTENPVLHFCHSGAIHGRAPTPLFDAAHVRTQLDWPEPDLDKDVPGNAKLSGVPKRLQADNSDIVELFVAVLENVEPPYISPHPLFDPELWLSTGDDAPGQNPVISFLSAETLKGRPFSPYVSLAMAMHGRPYLKAGKHNALLRYLADCDSGDIRDVNPMFHALYYKSVAKISVNDPLSHFITIGSRLGYPPNPYADAEIGITDADRLSDSLQQIYLDYLRCDGELAATKRSRPDAVRSYP